MIRSDDIPSNAESENASLEVLGAAVRRRPGRPKGLPKPAGSGRQPGTPNKVGQEARDLAAKYTPKAFKRLGELAQHPDPKVAVLAIQQILDRRFGKPIAPSEISGPDGTPLIPPPDVSDIDLARLTVFLLAKGIQEEGGDLPRARKPTVIEQKPADPFAEQRAEQAARIEAARIDETVSDTPYTSYEGAVAAQRAEDRLALAEQRPSRPVPVYAEPGGSLAEHGLSPRHRSPNVVRFKPR